MFDSVKMTRFGACLQKFYSPDGWGVIFVTVIVMRGSIGGW